MAQPFDLGDDQRYTLWVYNLYTRAAGALTLTTASDWDMLMSEAAREKLVPEATPDDEPTATPHRAPRRSRATAAASGESANGSTAANGTPRPSRAKRAATPPTDTASDAAASAAAPKRAPRRRTPPRTRGRESGVLGLGGRARLISDQGTTHYLFPDALVFAIPNIRQAFFSHTLDDALRMMTQELAAAVAPAVVQVWLADPAATTGEQGTLGGLELLPTLRLRAVARAAVRDQVETGRDALIPIPTTPPNATPAADHASDSGEMLAVQQPHTPQADPLIEDVVTRRQIVSLVDTQEHPLARTWAALVPPTYCPVPTADNIASPAPSQTLGTLAAYPLMARGQLLGVLALAARARLAPRQLAALADVADLAALAADRDRLLSYSHGEEALAQTAVQHAPVAMAVLSGPEYTLRLVNPMFALLLGLPADVNPTGQRLADVLPGRAERLIASLRVDAVYSSGQPQAMLELPIAIDHRGLTYWNVNATPLPSVGGGVGGALIAAVDVTRQVQARQRAQESAEMAQDRIGQMMTLHATSLAVSSQLGTDNRELLADILRRSIALLNARAGTVYVRDPRANMLEVVVCRGLRGDYTGDRIRIGDGLAGQVAQQGHGMIVDDYRAYPFRAAIYGDEDVTAVIAVPLIHHGQVVGVLDVLDDAERRAFNDDDLWLLDLFAAQAAQAIENARTYVELEHAYRKQRELDRMKDDFIATASHELRTPLTGVQGFLDLLLEYPGSRDEPLALDFLNKAVESAQELAEVSERLLQTSRLDTGRVEMHLGPLRVATVAEEVLHSFRAFEEAQGTEHELVMDISQDFYVQGDLGRVKEVLENLVGNAIKYSPHGGKVTVRCVPAHFQPSAPSAPQPSTQPAAANTANTANMGTTGAQADAIEESPTMVLSPLLSGGDAPDPHDDPSMPMPEVVAAASEQPYYTVLVHDEGMGIPANERPKLFGRFSRLDSARASQIRGTGLGLYICRQMLRAMGGDIWLAESEPGKGSTFAFTLPAVAPQQQERTPVASGGYVRQQGM